MTARDRAHRAFANASMASKDPNDPRIPRCYGQNLGGPADGGPCGVLCDRVTDAIELAQAGARADVGLAMCRLAEQIEAER